MTVLALSLASPAVAADCVEHMSRIPAAGAGAPAAGPYRAAMLRTGPAVKAPSPGRPRAMAARTAVPKARKARPIRKASAHRPARKHPAGVRRAAAGPAPAAIPARAPTPIAAAAAELATPLSYALIKTTVCESGPPLVATEVATPGLVVVPGGPGAEPYTYEPSVAPPPGPDTVLPPEVFPPAPGPTGPTGGTGTYVPPPGPPGPPTGPPPRPPPTPTPVPEPGTWALMILGFGVMGGRLRTRRAISPS